MNDVVAILLAAGKGTRMRSRTAKVLHPLLGRALLAYPLEAVAQAGVVDAVVVVGHQADEVKEQFADSPVRFALQEEQRGTAHAVNAARPAVALESGMALILSGDVPLIRTQTLLALIDAHRSSEAKVTLLTMTPADPTGYGRVIRDAKGATTHIVEERDATEQEREVREVNSGTYVVTLPWLWNTLDAIRTDNAQQEYYLTDIIAAAAANGGVNTATLSDPTEVEGVNSRADLARATARMRRRILHSWMERGVTMEDPATIWVEPSVTLAPE